MRALAFAWNVRLGIGLMLAWALSAASLLSRIRRLPAMAVLLRRRLRHSVVPQRTPPQPPDAAALLRQNNALPGNRVDGFRFDHLRLMIVLTPVYLWLELSFGVSLLDKMGSSLPIDETAAVEHWGRLISGLALALLFLKIWLQQCEKWNRGWLVTAWVSLVIAIFSIGLMWRVQDAVIEFHVHRGGAEIAIGLFALAVALAVGGLVWRLWLVRSMANRRQGVLATLLGLGALFFVGAVILAYLDPLLNALTRKTGMEERVVRDLGRERQRAAKLTVIRRGLQLGHYSHETLPVSPGAVDSAEGKAALALFPIIASGMDLAFFAPEQVRVVSELMYHDWERENADAAFQAYQEVEKDVAQASPGRSPADLAADPAVQREFRMAAACNDCEFRFGMSRDDYARELHRVSERENVKTSVANLESAEHFETGRDGESAARTYWVPIWALLFSMVGAVVHLFKMAFTLTEYVQRRAFQAAGAADSVLAQRVVDHSRRLIALGIVALSLFIFFWDNRVTGNPNYVRLHQSMWTSQPVVGAIAAHWTINAQGLAYPFTRKIRPAWLDFDTDPLSWMPARGPGSRRETR